MKTEEQFDGLAQWFNEAAKGYIERIEELKAEKAEMLEALESIRLYGADTLSGRVDGDDDREWQREAVKEMTRRAGAAIGRNEG